MKEITFDIDTETEVLELQRNRIEVYREIQSLTDSRAKIRLYGEMSNSTETRKYVNIALAAYDLHIAEATERFHSITERYEGLK